MRGDATWQSVGGGHVSGVQKSTPSPMAWTAPDAVDLGSRSGACWTSTFPRGGATTSLLRNTIDVPEGNRRRRRMPGAKGTKLLAEVERDGRCRSQGADPGFARRAGYVQRGHVVPLLVIPERLRGDRGPGCDCRFYGWQGASPGRAGQGADPAGREEAAKLSNVAANLTHLVDAWESGCQAEWVWGCGTAPCAVLVRLWGHQ